MLNSFQHLCFALLCHSERSEQRKRSRRIYSKKTRLKSILADSSTSNSLQSFSAQNDMVAERSRSTALEKNFCRKLAALLRNAKKNFRTPFHDCNEKKNFFEARRTLAEDEKKFSNVISLLRNTRKNFRRSPQRCGTKKNFFERHFTLAAGKNKNDTR